MCVSAAEGASCRRRIGVRPSRTSVSRPRTRRRSLGSSWTATQRSMTTSGTCWRPALMRASRMTPGLRSRSAGGCDFAAALDTAEASPNWTPAALPTKLVLADAPPSLRQASSGSARFPQSTWSEEWDRTIQWRDQTLRLFREPSAASTSLCVAIPLDELLNVRILALRQLAAFLQGTDPVADPQALTLARRRRLIEALRALDGRLDGASYREIAATLFGVGSLPERGWKTHDLRDRTIRLARYGRHLMNGGYRSLLLHPYRRKR